MADSNAEWPVYAMTPIAAPKPRARLSVTVIDRPEIGQSMDQGVLNYPHTCKTDYRASQGTTDCLINEVVLLTQIGGGCPCE